jgi:hypothetical protein
VTEPIPQYEPLSPVDIEKQLRWVLNALTRAQAGLREARDEEVAAKHVFERAHRLAMLSGACPKVTRGGFTTAERDSWVNEQSVEPREAYELAEAKRRAAEDHLRTLRDQSMVMATLAKSVHQAYAMSGVPG